jgi:hypothetical protein
VTSATSDRAISIKAKIRFFFNSNHFYEYEYRNQIVNGAAVVPRFTALVEYEMISLNATSELQL